MVAPVKPMVKLMDFEIAFEANVQQLGAGSIVVGIVHRHGNGKDLNPCTSALCNNQKKSILEREILN